MYYVVDKKTVSNSKTMHFNEYFKTAIHLGKLEPADKLLLKLYALLKASYYNGYIS